MARQKKIALDGVAYTLQSVSPSWYFDLNDRTGMTGGKKNLKKYMDELFRNCVVAPADVRDGGMAYFDERDDIAAPENLTREIEEFLRSGEQPIRCMGQGKKEP